jgi:signal transduction histidine kinase
MYLALAYPSWQPLPDHIAMAVSQRLLFGTVTFSPLPETVAWVLAGTMLVLLASCWLSLRSVQAKRSASTAKNAVLQRSLDEAAVRISDFSSSQARFVASLAQELRDPLAAVLVQASLLVDNSSEPATVERYTKRVAEDVRHLSDLVESFLRLARPLAHEDTSHHVPVHIHDLVLDAVQRCQSLATTCAVKVVPMLAESAEASVVVLGDDVLLGTMVENLLRNAMLSAPHGTQVDLHVKVHGDEVRLSVRDHGAHADSARLETVFDGYFQLQTLPRPSAATGLSLAIAKRVAEHHRGSLALHNVPDGGCAYEVQLPRWWPNQQPGPSANGRLLLQEP